MSKRSNRGSNVPQSLPLLLKEIRSCRHCEADLELGPRPILELDNDSRILIVGQAPGRRVHESGVAWHDPSGERLRSWMGVSREQFYDKQLVAIVPMGFCYPGKGNSGDLPPRPECAELWHDRVIAQLSNVKLTLVIGKYAQSHVLGDRQKPSLTETVRSWQQYRPKIVPLPHPSPRNVRWFKANPWFEENVIPYLKRRVASLCR
ncbi:MAG: uracil-DNA glycosylase family protein [Planctomycetota bacterium]